MAEKTVEQFKQESSNHLETLKEWGKTRGKNEQIIYEEGYNGNMVVSAISGDRVKVLSLLYDVLEQVSEQADVDFIPMIMGFLQIYHVKAEKAKTEKESKETPET